MLHNLHRFMLVSGGVNLIIGQNNAKSVLMHCLQGGMGPSSSAHRLACFSGNMQVTSPKENESWGGSQKSCSVLILKGIPENKFSPTTEIKFCLPEVANTKTNIEKSIQNILGHL